MNKKLQKVTSGYQGVIHRYNKHLPINKNTPVITLKEGNTPLIYARYLSECVGKNFEVYFPSDTIFFSS